MKHPLTSERTDGPTPTGRGIVDGESLPAASPWNRGEL
jgi:hypothetical protein